MVYANSMDDRYLSQIANGWSERCVCMYACHYRGSGGRAWIVVIDERAEIFYYCDALEQGRAAATPLNDDGWL